MTRRVAILTASTHPSNGWGRFTGELVRQLVGLGVAPTVLTVEGDHGLQGAPGVRSHDCLPDVWVTNARGRLLRALWRAHPLVRDCSVIHCVSAPYAPLARWLAGRRRFVVSGIGTFLVRPLRDRRLARRFRKAYARADAIPCISRYTRDALQAELPGLRNTSIVQPGVDVERFHRLAHRPSGAAPRVLSVGALKERKGHEYTLAAFARVLERLPEAQLTVAGRVFQPSQLERLHARIRELGMEKNVEIATDLDDAALLSEYQRADLFVLMSINVGDTFEGYGQVFTEAAACGVPGVGSSGCGVEDAIVDGETGLLVKQKDVAGLADAMTRLLTDDALRERMGDAAHALAQRRSWRAVAERYLELYGLA